MDRIAFAKGCATSSSIALREAVWGGLTRARCASPNGVPGGQRSHGGSRRGRAGSCSRRGLLRSPRPNKPLQLTGCPAAFEQALISTPWPGSPACGPLPSSRPRALRRARHRKPRCARLATPALLRPVASFQARALASGPQLNGVVFGWRRNVLCQASRARCWCQAKRPPEYSKRPASPTAMSMKRAPRTRPVEGARSDVPCRRAHFWQRRPARA